MTVHLQATRWDPENRTAERSRYDWSDRCFRDAQACGQSDGGGGQSPSSDSAHAWVYFVFGKNIVKTMLRLAEIAVELTVISDQWGNPTSLHGIADGTLHIAGGGPVSFSSLGYLSPSGGRKCDLGRLRPPSFGHFRRARRSPDARQHIPTADYLTRARWRAYWRSDNKELKTPLGWSCRPWQHTTNDVNKAFSLAAR